jgi:hypothetical protein
VVTLSGIHDLHVIIRGTGYCREMFYMKTLIIIVNLLFCKKYGNLTLGAPKIRQMFVFILRDP